MGEPADFFVVGGTLRAQSPSYVTRPADQELFDHALAGEFCYVLTSRQMGKSSLMVRTARRLEAGGVRAVIVDLTSIGTVSVDEWHLGLLSRIRTSLRLPIDPAAWWAAHASLSPAHRFMEFLRDVLLAEITTPIVIFIDEIDTTLNLAFRDDFFAAIRAMYNERATTPIYQRLTFVLLGVATPTDLIQDRDRTPFNIGRRIVLEEFSYDDAAPLQQGLDERHAQQGGTILRAIFAWTGGHPYLTQKLCQLASTADTPAWDASAVEQLVKEHFLAEDAPDDNLKFVQSRVQASPPAERRRMLRLYRRIHAGERVADDDRSRTQNYLELFGLVRAAGDRLHVRNEIYRRVFDQRWIKATMPPLASRGLAITLSLAAVLVVALAVRAYFYQPSATQIVVSAYVEQFRKSINSDVRMSVLASLLKLQRSIQATATAGGASVASSDDELAGQAARELFLGLPPADQRALFLDSLQSSPADIQLVVEGLYPALNWVADDRDDPRIMQAMSAALKRGRPTDLSLMAEIDSWMAGRQAANAGDYKGAISSYSAALQVYASSSARDVQISNPALRFDRALALAQLDQYDAALADLDRVVELARKDPISQVDDRDLPKLIQQPTSPGRFVSANRTIAIVQRQLNKDPKLLAELETKQAKFPELARECQTLLEGLRTSQTAAALAAATQAALAAQATVAAVGGPTATVLAQTALAQASTGTSAAQTNQTATAIAVAAVLTPSATRTPRPTSAAVTSTPTASPAPILDLTATTQVNQTATAAVQPSVIVFVKSPKNIGAGAALPQIDVQIQNSAGQPTAADGQAVTLSIEPGTGAADGALLGETSASTSGGVASFSGLTIRRAGAGYRLRATVDGLRSALSKPFDVAPGPAVKLVFADQPGQAEILTASQPEQVVVEARDRFDNLATGFDGQVEITIAGTGASRYPPNGENAAPNIGGVFVVRNLGNAVNGRVTLSGQTGCSAFTCEYTISATGLPKVKRTYVVEIRAKRLGFAFSSSPAVVGIPLSFSVAAVDADGLVSNTFGGNVTLSIQSGPDGGAFGAQTQLSASLSDGQVNFQAALSKPGTYVLKATSGSLSGVSGPIDVVAAPAPPTVTPTPPTPTMGEAPLPTDTPTLTATPSSTSTPSPTATATPPAAPTQVIVYDGANFAGSPQSLGSGEYGATPPGVPLGNDKIKSLRIPQGWSVVLYRDFVFQLPSPILTQDVADANAITAGVSGVCVRAPGEDPQTCPNMQPTPTATPTPPPAQVVVYDGANFTGSSQSLGSGEYGATPPGVPLGNDKIKSLRIPQGWSVVLYRDFVFQLPSPILTQDIADANGVTAGVSGICVRAPGEDPQTCPNMAQ